MQKKAKVLINRFLRGAVSGMLATALPVIAMVPGYTLKELKTWIAILAIACVIGFITGLFMAVDKYLRYKK